MALINRRKFLKAMTLGTISLAAGCNPFRGKAGAPPNIIIILADDLGYGDPGCYNPDSRISTPNMDDLARQGVRFTDAHAPAAVCSPTRYGLLTGRYCWRTWLKRGVVGGYTPPLIEPGRMTVASLLKQQGYITGCFGKWHLGLGWARQNGFTPSWKEAEQYWRGSWQDGDPKTGMNVDFTKPVKGGPRDLGFDYAFFTAACSTMDAPFVYIENDRTIRVPNRPVSDFYDMNKGEEGSPRPGWIAPDFVLEEVDLNFTKKAIEFIERSRRDFPDKPFLVYLALSSPHTPWLPPVFVKGKSQDGPRGDLVILADWCIGEVAKALERIEAARDTLLIVTSDNGPHPGGNGHKSVGPLRGYKSHIWEGGHRVPFIVSWPGKCKPGTTNDEPVCLTDFLATIAAITRVRLPDEAGPDSYDITPALLGKQGQKPIREALVSHSENGTFAIRQGEWKLILDNKTSGGWMVPEGEPPKPGTPGQLYNLAEDPFEQNDLWEKRPEVVERLAALLEKYKREGRSAPISSG